MLVEPYCCLFEGVDSRLRGNDRGQVLKDAKLQPKPPKKSTYNRDVHPKCRAKIKKLDVWVTSREDTILSKLEWAKNSHSEQQLRDALGVAVVQWHRLDIDYMHKWAKELRVESSLKQLLQQARKLLDSK